MSHNLETESLCVLDGRESSQVGHKLKECRKYQLKILDKLGTLVHACNTSNLEG